MAKNLLTGPLSSTPVPGVDGAITLTLPEVNFASDYRLIEDEPGVVRYTNIRSATDQPLQIRIASKRRPNIYAGTTIDPSAFLPNKEGMDVVVETTWVIAVEDSEASDYTAQFPVRAAITFNVPRYALVDGAFLKGILAEAVAHVFAEPTEAGEVVADGLDSVLRGSLYK